MQYVKNIRMFYWTLSHLAVQKHCVNMSLRGAGRGDDTAEPALVRSHPHNCGIVGFNNQTLAHGDRERGNNREMNAQRTNQ